jgi:hypothetical protein
MDAVSGVKASGRRRKVDLDALARFAARDAAKTEPHAVEAVATGTHTADGFDFTVTLSTAGGLRAISAWRARNAVVRWFRDRGATNADAILVRDDDPHEPSVTVIGAASWPITA